MATDSLRNIKLPPSPWLQINQAMIDQFASASLDPDRMHIDPQWAAKHSPYGETIAFGFQTLSYLSHFSHQVLDAAGVGEQFNSVHGHALNYGFERVRFIAPVRVNRRIRAVFDLVETQTSFSEKIEFDVKIEIEGEDRPALAARWIWMWVPRESGRA